MSTGSITQTMLHGLERNLLPLGQHISPSEVRDGDLVSIDRNGCVVPLDADLEFAGIADGIGQEQGMWKVSTLIRGTISIPIKGLSLDVKLGSKIYVMVNGKSESFSLDGPGTVIGELGDIELDQGIGTIRIDVAKQGHARISLGSFLDHVDMRGTPPHFFSDFVGFFS